MLRKIALAFSFALALLLALDLAAHAVSESSRKDGASETARPTRLRRPTREVREPDESSLLTVLPEFARDELLIFEEKLLEHRKAKRASTN